VPSLGVEAGQLRPDNSYVERVLGAADDIRLCKMIFNGWTTHLDRCDTLFLSPSFLFPSLASHGETSDLNRWDLSYLQSQLGEAGRASEGRPTTSQLVDGIRELLFGGCHRDRPLPRQLCVHDGVADQRRGGAR